MQGNSIFALVALSNAVSSLEDENVSKEESHQYVTMRHWLLKVADTVIVVFDGNAKTAGKPFQWCQQVVFIFLLFYFILLYIFTILAISLWIYLNIFDFQGNFQDFFL